MSDSYWSYRAAAPIEIMPGEPDDEPINIKLYCRACGARIQDEPTEGGDVFHLVWDFDETGSDKHILYNHNQNPGPFVNARIATQDEIDAGESYTEVNDPVWECPRCMTQHDIDDWQYWY